MSSGDTSIRIWVELDLLYKLKAAGVSLHYRPQGVPIVNLTPGQALQLLADEDKLAANILGIRLDHYKKWKESGVGLRKKQPNFEKFSCGYIRCAAKLGSGDRCSNAVHGPLSPEVWLQHQGGNCATHRHNEAVFSDEDRNSIAKNSE